MGWFNTVLDVTGVAIDVANYSQISKIQKQNADMKQQEARKAAVETILNALRDEVFACKQAAEGILLKEQQAPMISAYGMILLQNKLSESPISPEIFSELNDKEYTAATIRFIENHAKRLISKLSSKEQAEVHEVVLITNQLEIENYYIENYQDAVKLRNALSIIEKYKKSIKSEQSLGCAILLGIVTIGGTIVTIMTFVNKNIGTICLLLFFAGIIWAVIRVGKPSNEQKIFDEAKKIVKLLEDKIDLIKFNEIDQKFNGDFEKGQSLRDKHQSIIDRFLASYSITYSKQVAIIDNQQESGIRQLNTSIDIINKDIVTVNASLPKLQKRFCGYCGYKLPTNANFCPSCGKKI